MSSYSKKGRPSSLNSNTVQKLEEAIKCGSTVEDACSYANISRSTYYNYLNTNMAFLDKMNSAKIYLKFKSKLVVMKAIEKNDLKTAKWYLEKYDAQTVEQVELPQEQITKEEITVEDVAKIQAALDAINGVGRYCKDKNIVPRCV